MDQIEFDADYDLRELISGRRGAKGQPVTLVISVDGKPLTSEVPALLRNALTGQVDGNAVMLLSAPASHLGRILELLGTRELIKAKVKTLVISEAAGPSSAAGMEKLLASWPTPIVLCERPVGEALPFPGSSLEADFAWSPAHPVADAYRAYQPMPYGAPSYDMAAVLYAVRPDAGLFTLSEPGTIGVSGDGTLKFTLSPSGRHRSIAVDPAQKDRIIQVHREVASAKPVPRPQFRSQPKKEADPVKAPADKPAGIKAPATL